MQHLCVRTAQEVNPDDPDWEDTATPGRRYSYKYGYGALNGVEFVNAALAWQSVKPQAFVHMPTIQIAGGTMDVRDRDSEAYTRRPPDTLHGVRRGRLAGGTAALR